MRYYANVSIRGPVKAGDLPFSIGVHDEPGGGMPIGQADGGPHHESGVKTWRLAVRGRDLPGLFFLVDGEFEPVK